ncbi:helix-turn-helix domain-containing protein [Chitinophaga sp. RAB17]|uniref:helix-turn-helix domain-containing protein n=1 Tax=Chitinophaga sp. RAB17 TaxID=3233049 RepID=UPI003F90CFCE
MPVDILAHIICHHASAGVQVLQPATALLHAVECYCWYTHLHNRKVWAAIDGQPALVFLLNAGSIKLTGQYEKVISDGCFCNGTLENTYFGEMPAGTQLLVVKFTADGWAYLKPLLARSVKVSSPIMELPATLLPLLTAIRKSASPQEQAMLLNAFLVQQLPDDITGNFLLQAAANIIRESQGKIAVSDICTSLKVNYKWLERSFRISTGVTPKHYISNIRFLHAWSDVQHGAQPLTGIALDNGYYDQNHFIKAYKKYTGMLPSAAK